MATRLTAGIDVGGTRLKSILIDPQGVVRFSHTSATPKDPGPVITTIVDDALARLRDAAQAKGGTVDVERVGVVVPGLVDDAHGVALWSANLQWRDLPLLELLTASCAMPVAVGHDVRAGLLAEARLGAARGMRDVLFVPLGTGIAAAMLAGGQVVSGSPWTGEVGHVVIDPEGPACPCGRRGCLEAISSAAAITRAWRAMGREGDAKDVAAAVEAGDREAITLWHTAIDALARTLAPACATAGTRLVLIGGGLALAGQTLLDPMRDRLSELLGNDQVAVAPAALGDQAGALGAALLAQEAFA